MFSSISTRLSFVAIFVAFFVLGGFAYANAQTVPTTCPSATVFYSNGYSMNPCLPSYYPGYPQTTVYNGIPAVNNNGYYYNPGTVVTTQYNPFTPPVTNNNGIFAPYQTVTAPTYYYPYAPQTPVVSGPFYNVPNNSWGYWGGCYSYSCNNGWGGRHHGGWDGYQ